MNSFRLKKILGLLLFCLCSISYSKIFNLKLKNSEDTPTRFSAFYYSCERPKEPIREFVFPANSTNIVEFDIRDNPQGDYIDVVAIGGKPTKNEKLYTIYILSSWLRQYGFQASFGFSIPLIVNYRYLKRASYKIDFTDYIVATQIEFKRQGEIATLEMY